MTPDQIAHLTGAAFAAGLDAVVAAYGEGNYSHETARAQVERAVAARLDGRLDSSWIWRIVWHDEALTQPAFEVVIEERSAVDRLADLSR